MSKHQNSDTYTKLYVTGLPWTTRDDGLISFFQQFGEILHANVVCDRSIDRSQGYGFITFRDAESATRACANPNPTIDGRTTSCRLASEGRNINQNQPNSTCLRNDDLCYLSQSFMQQRANYYQPYPTHFDLYWNQYYQQYNPQHVPQGVYPQYVWQGVYPPYLPQGGYPPYLPQEIYSSYVPQGVYLPYVPQGVYFLYIPQGVYPPQVTQGVYPPQVPQELYPPQVPQELYPQQVPQEVNPPHVPQRGYPSHVPQRGYPPQVPQEVYPHVCSTRNLSAISLKRSLSAPCSTTTTYGQHQSMNEPEENQGEFRSSVSSFSTSTQESSLDE
ncbi:unnamed protein product [Cochlearia groenlandica]